MADDAEVLTGAELTKEAQDDIQEAMSFFNTFLLIFAGIALFVGAFIIYNTFSIIITQRQKEMALLRAIGASGKQVVRSVMVEATVVGGLASAVRSRRGHRRSHAGLKALLGSLRRRSARPADLVISTSTIVISIVVGTGRHPRFGVLPGPQGRQGATDRSDARHRQSRARGRPASVSSSEPRSPRLGVASLVAVSPAASIKLVGIGALATFVGVTVLAPGARSPRSSPARLAGRTVDSDDGLACSPQRDAEPQAHRIHCCGTDDRRRPRRVHLDVRGLGQVIAQRRRRQRVQRRRSCSTRAPSAAEAASATPSPLNSPHDPSSTRSPRARLYVAEIAGETADVQSWDAATLPTLFDIDPKQGRYRLLWDASGIALHEDYAEGAPVAPSATASRSRSPRARPI